MNKLLLGALESLLPLIISSVSNELKAEAKAALDKLEIKAKATANPFDDVLVKILRGIVGL